VDSNIQSVEISEDDYERLRGAREGLLLVLDIEEKFDLLFENYAEYELSLLEVALRSATSSDNREIRSSSDRRILNRRIANYLTTARLYVDQVTRDAGTLHSELSARVSTSFAAQYDSQFAYRIVEALRNHIQHHGLPVHSISYTSARDEVTGLAGHGVIPSFEVQRARSDDKFKKSVLPDIEARQNARGYLNLTPMIRGHMCGIGRAHEDLRGALLSRITEWDGAFDGAHSRLIRELGLTSEPSAVWLAAPSSNVDSLSISRDFVERRRRLAGKNNRLDRLGEVFVTSSSVEAFASVALPPLDAGSGGSEV
jgi:hypothetical protein